MGLINDNTLSERTNLDVSEIMLGIRLCVNNMFFSANNKIYQQIQGLPMVSNLSPVLANIAMQYIETTALSTFNNSVKLWKRYVDDTFVIIKKQLIDDLHRHINSIHPGIQFTIEKEQNHSISFLDI